MDKSVDGPSFEEIQIPVPFGFVSGMSENFILCYIKYNIIILTVLPI